MIVDSSCAPISVDLGGAKGGWGGVVYDLMLLVAACDFYYQLAEQRAVHMKIMLSLRVPYYISTGLASVL